MGALSLWIAIVVVIAFFGRMRTLAAWLLAPYLAWVTFAMALTWSVRQRNPAQL